MTFALKIDPLYARYNDQEHLSYIKKISEPNKELEI